MEAELGNLEKWGVCLVKEKNRGTEQYGRTEQEKQGQRKNREGGLPWLVVVVAVFLHVKERQRHGGRRFCRLEVAGTDTDLTLVFIPRGGSGYVFSFPRLLIGRVDVKGQTWPGNRRVLCLRSGWGFLLFGWWSFVEDRKNGQGGLVFASHLVPHPLLFLLLRLLLLLLLFIIHIKGTAQGCSDS